MNARFGSTRFTLLPALSLVVATLCLGAIPPTVAHASTVFAPSKSIQIAGVFSPKSPIAGKPAKLTVMVVSPRGKLVNGAKITADVNMVSMDMGTTHPAFKPIGSGKYAASVVFTMGGPWAVKVHITAAGVGSASKTLKVTVADQQ